MPINGLQRITLRCLLRQADILNKRKGVLWLQRPPLIQEFQSSVYSTSAEGLKEFASLFPARIQPFILEHTLSRVINGNDLKRIVRSAFRADASLQSLSDMMESMKIVNTQVPSPPALNFPSAVAYRRVLTHDRLI
jgi:hypothetical protein